MQKQQQIAYVIESDLIPIINLTGIKGLNAINLRAAI